MKKYDVTKMVVLIDGVELKGSKIFKFEQDIEEHGSMDMTKIYETSSPLTAEMIMRGLQILEERASCNEIRYCPIWELNPGFNKKGG